jgi:hypothetical protein
MREGHVSDTEIAKDTHDANVVANHVAAFDTDQRGNFSIFVGAANFIGSGAENQILGILADHFVDGVNLIERFLDGRRAHGAAIDPNRKEDGVHAALAHARDIYAAIGIAFRDIEGLGEESLCGIVVSVQNDRREMQFSGAFGEVIAAGRRNQKRTSQQKCAQTQTGEQTARQ